jgi:DNA-binding response OmpR family regulator
MHEIHAEPLSTSQKNGRMNFPVVPIGEVPVPASSSDTIPDRPMVLVVDDEPAIADTVSAILNQNGYAALTAYDGKDALETALLIRPELVITDIGLPDMSGIEVATALRKEIPDCKVLLFSGYGTAPDALTTADGTTHKFEVVVKPVHPSELLTRVAASLKSQ